MSSVDRRNFYCGCNKAYLSYPALYTHVKNKHNREFPIGSNSKHKINEKRLENYNEYFDQSLTKFYDNIK